MALIIGLISDTHIGYPGDILPSHIKGGSRGVALETLPVEVLEALRGVDLILHAGDIYMPSVLDELESVAPVMAAWGDDDVAVDFGADKRLKKRHTLVFNGVTLWLTHVKPTFWLIDPDEELYFLASDLEDTEDPEAISEPPDIIVHGHSHFASVEHFKETAHNKNILVMNPGSATFPDYVAKLGSVALLTINSGEVETRIVPLG